MVIEYCMNVCDMGIPLAWQIDSSYFPKLRYESEHKASCSRNIAAVALLESVLSRPTVNQVGTYFNAASLWLYF